ncbi:hypothetical protein CcI49_09075 [Frankia sp. CcI49]|uniref:DUF4184 family protein n=1 Tax=unclassified Frankia TaxID=2632575 RepID=UPI0006C9F510|nr:MULTISPECIES: DUF4184 family protein [unclassified Frankia]KPM50926.1 hypothetical protein ACG83_36210 [Frankia sp. R43]ONH60747.1 hypothetical protein CcI49_09075 [Frankia sp. CcI49]
MPFTASHPAAVLPLRGLGLPMSAMVVGSMVPDVPVFGRWADLYRLTHSLLGIVTVVPALTIAVLLVWSHLVRDALVDLAPDAVRLRLAPRARLSRRQWMLAPAAAMVGGLTHVGWDLFTHRDRWGFHQFAWLRAEHGGLPGYGWLQYASSVAGLAIVALAAVAHLRALPRGPRRPRRHPSQAVILPMGVLVAVVPCVAAAAAATQDPRGLRAVAFEAAVAGVLALIGTLLIIVAGWWAVRPR